MTPCAIKSCTALHPSTAAITISQLSAVNRRRIPARTISGHSKMLLLKSNMVRLSGSLEETEQERVRFLKFCRELLNPLKVALRYMDESDPCWKSEQAFMPSLPAEKTFF